MAQPFGRPTKLTKAIIVKANEYLEDCSNISTYSLLPTIEGLALHLGIHRETLRLWENENDDFFGILERLRAAQAQKLIQNSLAGRYNSTISKLMLSKHDYVEKTEQDVSHSGAVSFVNDVPRPKNGNQSSN